MEWVRPFFGLAWGAIGWDRVYCEGMRDTDLFQLALGLQSPWTVTRSEFAVEDGRLDLSVDFPRGSRFACAGCGGEGCAVHDTKDETWRHLDFFQHRTLLHHVDRVVLRQAAHNRHLGAQHVAFSNIGDHFLRRRLQLGKSPSG